MPMDFGILFQPNAAVNDATSEIGYKADQGRAAAALNNSTAATNNAELPYVADKAQAGINQTIANTGNLNATTAEKNATLPFVAQKAQSDIDLQAAQVQNYHNEALKFSAALGKEGSIILGKFGTVLSKQPDDASADAMYQQSKTQLQQMFPTLQLPEHVDRQTAASYAAMAGYGANALPDGFDKWTPEMKNNYARQHEESFGKQTPAGAITDPQKIMAQENDLRKEYGNQVKDFSTTTDSYNQIQKIASLQPGDPAQAASDKSLLYAYLKVIDPNLKVRPGMTAAAGDVESASGTLLAKYNKVIKGETLTPDARASIIADATNLYNARKQKYDQTTQQYTDIANRQGLNPQNVIINQAAQQQAPDVNQIRAQIKSQRPDLSDDQINQAIQAAQAKQPKAPVAQGQLQGSVPSIAQQPSQVATPQDAVKKIALTAQQMGVSPSTAIAIAGVESAFKPSAHAGTSSAAGLYQFVRGTANMIANSPEGQAAGLTSEGIRNNPEQNIKAGMLLAMKNTQTLQKKGIENPTPVDLYMMHFGGNPKAVLALRDNPNASAASFYSNAQIQANRAVFYDGGRLKTVGQVAQGFQNRLQSGLQKGLQLIGSQQPVGGVRDSYDQQQSSPASLSPQGVAPLPNPSSSGQAASIPNLDVSPTDTGANIQSTGYQLPRTLSTKYIGSPT